jgi:TRAP-type mannitol/chloroaromatic compound transport system permease small subunit
MTDHPQSRQRLWVRLFLLAVFLTPVVSILCFAAIRCLGHDIRP